MTDGFVVHHAASNQSRAMVMRFPRQIQHLGLAALLLSKIRQDPDDLSTVLTLQRFLLRQIITAEHRVKRLKRAR
ncbi:hypothetical protein CVE36_02700, partial [Pseudomonas syringae pv. actinidiae]|nr:hypothetical protein [Pseudomonas syringae pv. actinidiae]